MAAKVAFTPQTFVEVRAQGKRHPNVSAVRRYQLVVTSGTIVAGDPSTGKKLGAVVDGVEPGKYPVFLYVPQLGGVGFAELRLSDEPVARWDKASSYGSLVGFGCFADEATALHEHYRRVEAEESDSYVEDVLHEALKDEGGQLRTAPRARENVVLFNSARSDGRCQNYLGLGAHGHPVCVVTDTGILRLEPKPAAVADPARQELAGTVAELRRTLGSALVGLGFAEGEATYTSQRLAGHQVRLPFEKGRIVVRLDARRNSTGRVWPNVWIGTKGREKHFDALGNVARDAGVAVPLIITIEQLDDFARKLSKHWAAIEAKL
ncbi:DUF4241 domain-containing protein [Nannocystis sp. SCPEA4]|uniref:DUF4241 domain-containing protein n=1 Tax=Nannocystis sp. SCPEA4 TaxID=2996787 RepID=UPI00226DA067|nr:DUF4241 domain-containing protein [Nannocystis sp. SCPEA4]MCY1054673.1 DUF4241 domain-containing protein [Nannocystis sp. SCPEA4]